MKWRAVSSFDVRPWYREEDATAGIDPAIHIRALSNQAWLKKPTLVPNFKVHELVALCGVALRLPTKTWGRLLRHLQSLQVAQRITSDEGTAIVYRRSPPGCCSRRNSTMMTTAKPPCSVRRLSDGSIVRPPESPCDLFECLLLRITPRYVVVQVLAEILRPGAERRPHAVG